MNDRELMQQALMALEEGMTSKEWRELVKALRERLAQPEQNPLTEKRIEELYSFWIVDCQDIVGFARAIERSKPQMHPAPDATAAAPTPTCIRLSALRTTRSQREWRSQSRSRCAKF
jgi:hypothetical protein